MTTSTTTFKDGTSIATLSPAVQKVVKLVFPPTSSFISKSILINDNQRVSEILQYATQLAGLQPGYSLYLPNSSSNRGLWLDDDQLIITYNLSNSDIIQIKKKPGFNKRKNTMMTLKGFKEGKVQKLSSITKIWIPRYLRLFSQRLVHSSNEHDTNTEFISFADIINVDRETSRKYAFIIQYYSTPTTSLTTTTNTGGNTSPSLPIPQQQQQPQQQRETKDYIFRCTNQNEAEDWVSSIRTMLKRARPDLFLPPLSILIGSSGNGNSNSNSTFISPPLPSSRGTGGSSYVSQSPTTTSSVSATNTPIKSTQQQQTSMSTPSTPTKPSHTWIEAIEHQQQHHQSSTEKTPTTKPRSFSFSLSRDKKKRESPPSTSSSVVSSGGSAQDLEYEIKRLKDTLEKESKTKQEIEAKYQKLKKKYNQTKTRTRSKSMSAPVTPEIIKKDRFNLNLPFIIGNSRIQTNTANINNNNSNNSSINLSSSSGSINNNHGGGNQYHQHQHNPLNSSLSLSQSIQQNLSLVDTNELTENDVSSDVFTTTNSALDIVGADAMTNNYIEEISDLKDQLTKIKQKLSNELVEERNQFDNTKKSLEKELFTTKKLSEKREREFINETTKHNDQIEILSGMAIRIKKSLIDLKDKLQIIQDLHQDQDLDLDQDDNGDEDIDNHYPDNNNNNNDDDSIMNDINSHVDTTITNNNSVLDEKDFIYEDDGDESSYILEQGDDSMISHETSITY